MGGCGVNEWKEVWYVWDGVGERPSFFSGVKLRNGGVITDEEEDIVKELCCHEWQHGVEGFEFGDIVAYTTGQKRRRVECGECFGEGLEISVNNDTGDLIIHDGIPCSKCNGTGKGWEYSE